MGKNKKFVSAITSRDEDFAKWYTDIVKKAELTDYSGIKGCMIIRPYGYAIWENIQADLDRRFKETGHQNVYMPMLMVLLLNVLGLLLVDRKSYKKDFVFVQHQKHFSANIIARLLKHTEIYQSYTTSGVQL